MKNWPVPDHGSRLLRRDALRVGGAGLLGLNLPGLLRAQESQTIASRPGKAKSVIFLFQWGGPSHVDTFDMKPDAPDGYRSLYKSIPTSVPDMRICEHLPETAKVMHRVAQIRTVHHTMNNHNSAGYTGLTGFEPPIDDQRLESPASTCQRPAGHRNLRVKNCSFHLQHNCRRSPSP